MSLSKPEKRPTEGTHLEPFELPFECLELTLVGMHSCNEKVWGAVLDSLKMPAK